MDVPAQLSSKGQLTVPKVVRDALGLVEGDQVVFASRASAPCSRALRACSISLAVCGSGGEARYAVAGGAATSRAARADARMSTFSIRTS